MADDALEADARSCLTFEQAKSRALAKVAERKAEAVAAEQGPLQTVRSAVDAYIAARETKERLNGTNKRDARARLTKHVLTAALAERPLHALTERDLTRWREALPANLAVATVQRLVGDFKAALNAAASRHRAALPSDLPLAIKNALRSGEATPPTARDKQALPDRDIRRLIEAAQEVDNANHWEGDLSRLVIVLAATGARFSQVVRLRVGDVQVDQNRIMVPVSRKGRGTKRRSHVAVVVGTDVISALVPVTAERRPSELLLERWFSRQESGRHWTRDRRGPWVDAYEMARPWNQIITTAGLPDTVVPYSLRHSSIVRQLRAGLPVRLVAALHDTSAAMIEAHYSAAIVDALDSLAAGAVVPLMSQVSDAENVVRLSR